MSSLTRPVYSARHGGLLDFLAPWTNSLNSNNLNKPTQHQHSALFSTSASTSAPPNADTPQPKATPAPSQPTKWRSKPSTTTKPARPTKPNASKVASKPTEKSQPPNSPRRKSIETRRPPPSSLELLSAIRSYSPPSHTNTSTQPASSASPQLIIPTQTPLVAAYAAHNQAILNLISGSQSGLFELAFTLGWLPIRRTGQAGRPKAADLARVLETAGRELGRPGGKAVWSEVKELVLWLSGESGMPGVDRWAQREVEKGADGAQRVIEVWKSLAADEHLELRAGDNAPDASSKEPVALSAELESAADSTGPLVSFKFYSSYIYARSIVHSTLPPATQPSFRSLLPSLVHPRAPVLKPMRDYALPQLRLLQFASPDEATARAKSWLRQVTLAQTWSRAPGGMLVLRHLNASLRRNQLGEAWDLWETVKEAVESKEVGWLTDRWAASAGKKWVDDREEAEALSGPWAPPEESRAEPGEVAPAGAEVEVNDTEAGAELAPSTDAPAAPARPPFSPDEAHFTQALVAPFLTGFAKLRMLSQANTIWVWLYEHGFTPGVVAWSGLIAGYASRGDVNAVEATWAQMLDSGVKPDGWAYLERARAYFEAKMPDEAMRVADALLADKHAVGSFSGGAVSPLVYTTLIGGLLSNGRHDAARAVLDQMGPQLNIHAVNLILKRATQGRKPDFAKIVETLRFVAEHELQPDVITFTMVLQALLTQGQRDAPTKLMAIMESMGIKPSTTTYGAIIHSLARTGNPDELKAAVEVLNEMERNGQQTNEIIYTSLIQGFLRAIAQDPRAEDSDGQHPYFKAALTLKSRMEGRHLALNRVGFNAIISAGLSLHSPWGTALALEAFRDLRKLKGVGARAGGDQREIQRDGSTVGAADTWYVLLDGFAQQADWARAREAVSEMERAGFEVRTSRLRRLVDNIMRGGWAR